MMDNTNFIFVGCPCPEVKLKELIKSGFSANFAAITHQDALLEGLYYHCPSMKVLSSWRVGKAKSIKDIFLKKEVLSYKNGKDNFIFVGGINLPVLSLLSRFWNTRKELKKIIDSKRANHVVIYETHTPFLLALATLQKKIDKSCLIIPDLPEFMSDNKGIIYNLLKRIDSKLLTWCMKKVDSFVLLSKCMQERIPIDNKPWVLVDGIYSCEEESIDVKKNSLKTILYTGKVDKLRGVDLLLDAFSKIEDPNYRLLIRGGGELQEKVIFQSTIDSRIKYLPPLTKADLRKIEKEVTVLVNPTPPDKEFTKYFFPSKTMEYMAVATPTVMYKLDCMSDEYEPYIFYVEGANSDALKDKLIEVCEKPQEELNEFGERARKFILENKTPQKQCKKILDLLNGI